MVICNAKPCCSSLIHSISNDLLARDTFYLTQNITINPPTEPYGYWNYSAVTVTASAALTLAYVWLS